MALIFVLYTMCLVIIHIAKLKPVHDANYTICRNIIPRNTVTSIKLLKDAKQTLSYGAILS